MVVIYKSVVSSKNQTLSTTKQINVTIKLTRHVNNYVDRRTLRV